MAQTQCAVAVPGLRMQSWRSRLQRLPPLQLLRVDHLPQAQRAARRLQERRHLVRYRPSWVLPRARCLASRWDRLCMHTCRVLEAPRHPNKLRLLLHAGMISTASFQPG